MANHVSAVKRSRQNVKRRDRNQAGRTRVRSAQKQVHAAIAAKDANATDQLRSFQSLVDAAASKGYVHANKAARLLRRAAKQLNAGKA